jgi:hypothetical protein
MSDEKEKGDWGFGDEEQHIDPLINNIVGQNNSGGIDINDLSEAEQIDRIESMKTNFVFFFGKPASGKSAILSTLLYHLQCNFTNDIGFSAIKNKIEGTCMLKTDSSKQLSALIYQYLSKRRFVPQTKGGFVGQIRMEYQPLNPDYTNLPGIDVTFLEMAGENFSDIENTPDKTAKLPLKVDVYFKVPKISMLFVLITKHSKAKQEDKKMNDFIEHIHSKNPALLSRSRIFLFIGEWDTYDAKNETPLEFVEKNMPKTYAKLKTQKNIISSFSIGSVDTVTNEYGENLPFITSFNLDFPYKMWKQIYGTFTGEELDKKPWWKKWLGL